TPNGGDVLPPSENAEEYDVMFLGSWIPEKGSYVLPKIWESVLSRRPSARLVLVGTGLPSDIVLRSFDPLLRSQVTVVAAFRGGEELAHHLRSARVFLLPSLREGSPLALLEAMSAGRSIVASRVGGVDDVLEDERTGLLFDSGDWVGAAARVVRL